MMTNIPCCPQTCPAVCTLLLAQVFSPARRVRPPRRNERGGEAVGESIKDGIVPKDPGGSAPEYKGMGIANPIATI